MNRWIGLFLCICCILICTAIPSLGQTAATGSILGVVTDQSGAAVPLVQMELRSVRTNATTQVVSDEQGRYAFPNVPPGTYTLSAQASGFRQAMVNGVVV
jgi:hypothetical protein